MTSHRLYDKIKTEKHGFQKDFWGSDAYLSFFERIVNEQYIYESIAFVGKRF